MTVPTIKQSGDCRNGKCSNLFSCQQHWRRNQWKSAPRDTEIVLRSCIRSALGTWTFSWGKTTRNDLPEVPVLKWLRGGVLWVCFSGAIFGFHLVRCSSHVHSVLRSTSFNPAEFKPETTARDVEKNFQEGFVKGFKYKNPFRFLRSLVVFAERRN